MKKEKYYVYPKNKLAYGWNRCSKYGAEGLECACSKFFTSKSLHVKIKEEHYNILRALNILQPALLIFQLDQNNQRTILTSGCCLLVSEDFRKLRMISLDFEAVRAVVTLLPTSSFSSFTGRKFDSIYHIKAGW